jgi:hypothetical protein
VFRDDDRSDWCFVLVDGYWYLKYVVFMILCFVLEKGYWFYVWIGAGERYRDLSEWMVICDLLVLTYGIIILLLLYYYITHTHTHILIYIILYYTLLPIQHLILSYSFHSIRVGVYSWILILYSHPLLSPSSLPSSYIGVCVIILGPCSSLVLVVCPGV